MRFSFFFFFNDTATTEIYTLSLHDALPICLASASVTPVAGVMRTPMLLVGTSALKAADFEGMRSEEHTSELQSRPHLVCRLLLEKKKGHIMPPMSSPDTPTTLSRSECRVSD